MDLLDFTNQYQNIILNSIPQLSDIRPSDWVEQNIIMGDPIPGPYRYTTTPYCREIIDCFSPDHPARKIAVMKGAQIGISAGVIIPILCWIISQSPGRTYFTVGAPDLIDKAVEKLDLAIDGAGLRHLIKPQVNRRKGQRTGDTNTKKDFLGGFINVTTPNNHKEWRDVSLKYGLIDDFESARSASKESGDTRTLMEQRFAAYANSMKIAYISTPEQKEDSNILAAYEMGDQRKYHTPCPSCGEAITWDWVVHDDDGKVAGGITWKQDELRNIIPGSVGYICPKCAHFYNDKKKHDYLNSGIWIPTASPKEQDFYSYHISALYAPQGMYDWRYYVQNWINIHPEGEPRKEMLYKTFVNVTLGLTYEEETTELRSNIIQRNIRQYPMRSIPEAISEADGNGRIILVTLGADMNGKEDDARLDWEIVAHAENGATYSVAHGSVGTFIPNEAAQKIKTDRAKWTYKEGQHNSVWPEFLKILDSQFPIDDSEDEMRIAISCLDSGHYTEHAYLFVEKTRQLGYNIVAVKGDKEDVMVKYGVDVRLAKQGLQHPNLYILQVGLYKDKLSQFMQLIWDGNTSQPPNFMNYPEPADGLYSYQHFFEHYEAEQKKQVRNRDGSTSFRWEKKNTKVQNHMFDCRIYSLAAIDVLLLQMGKHYKRKITWTDFVAFMTKG